MSVRYPQLNLELRLDVLCERDRRKKFTKLVI